MLFDLHRSLPSQPTAHFTGLHHRHEANLEAVRPIKDVSGTVYEAVRSAQATLGPAVTSLLPKGWLGRIYQLQEAVKYHKNHGLSPVNTDPVRLFYPSRPLLLRRMHSNPQTHANATSPTLFNTRSKRHGRSERFVDCRAVSETARPRCECLEQVKCKSPTSGIR